MSARCQSEKERQTTLISPITDQARTGTNKSPQIFAKVASGEMPNRTTISSNATWILASSNISSSAGPERTDSSTSGVDSLDRLILPDTLRIQLTSVDTGRDKSLGTLHSTESNKLQSSENQSANHVPGKGDDGDVIELHTDRNFSMGPETVKNVIRHNDITSPVRLRLESVEHNGKISSMITVSRLSTTSSKPLSYAAVVRNTNCPASIFGVTSNPTAAHRIHSFADNTTTKSPGPIMSTAITSESQNFADIRPLWSVPA